MGSSARNPFQATRFLLSCAQLAQLPPEAPEVAFAGRSNAGKSSALNAICGQRQLARVSKTPGRTQLLNFFELPGCGYLVDLPGYGYAKVPLPVRRQWGTLVSSYIERRDCLRGIVLIMDIRHPLTDFDQQMLEWSGARARPLHILLTKSDKLGFGAAKATLQQVRAELGAAASVQLFSSETKTGVDEARAQLARWLGIAA